MEIPTNIIVNNCKWIDRYSPQIPETRHPVRSMLLLLSCSMHVSRLTASPELNCYSLRQSVSNCRSFVFFNLKFYHSYYSKICAKYHLFCCVLLC